MIPSILAVSCTLLSTLQCKSAMSMSDNYPVLAVQTYFSMASASVPSLNFSMYAILLREGTQDVRQGRSHALLQWPTPSKSQ